MRKLFDIEFIRISGNLFGFLIFACLFKNLKVRNKSLYSIWHKGKPSFKQTKLFLEYSYYLSKEKRSESKKKFRKRGKEFSFQKKPLRSIWTNFIFQMIFSSKNSQYNNFAWKKKFSGKAFLKLIKKKKIEQLSWKFLFQYFSLKSTQQSVKFDFQLTKRQKI